MKRKYKILLHSLFWFYRLGFTELFRRVYKGADFSLQYIVHYVTEPLFLSSTTLFAAVFYVNYFIVMPWWFSNKKYWQTTVAWLLLLFFFTGTRYLIEEKLFVYWFNIHNYADGTSAFYYLTDSFYWGGSTVIMSIVFWVIDHWMKNEKEKAILQQAKTSAEMDFLKSQVNPHFLFNTLNNIYSLVYHQSEKALPAILKLSELMRYMTKESTADKIELSKEVHYIENFIELESLRTREEPSIDFSLKGNLNGQTIAPLLLIPFIENGFKHGIITDKNHPFTIRLTVNSHSLTLFTQNKINHHHKDHSSGIGLNNVKRRLELLYPGNYSLAIDKTSDYYICNLSINL